MSFNKLLVGLLFCGFVFVNSEAQQSVSISLTDSDIKTFEKADQLIINATNSIFEGEQLMTTASANQSDANDYARKSKVALNKQVVGYETYSKAIKMKFDIYVKRIDDYNYSFTGNADELAIAKADDQQARSDYQSAQTQKSDAESEQDAMLKSVKYSIIKELEISSLSKIKQAFDAFAQIPLTGSSSSNNSTTPVLETISSTSLTDTSSMSSLTSLPELSMSDLTALPPSDAALGLAAIPAVVETPSAEIPVAALSDTTASNTNTSLIIDTTSIRSTPINTTPEAKSENIYQAVKVNENMIDPFNKFLTETYPNDYEGYVINYSSIDYSSVESIKTAWEKYQSGKDLSNAAPASANEVAQVNNDTTKQNISDLLVQNATTPVTIEPIVNPEESNNTQKKSKQTKKKKVKAAELATDNYSQSTAASVVQEIPVEGFTYQVQIAASIVPISKELMLNIYKGAYEPQLSKSIKWYRYSVGSFNTHNEALAYKEECGVPDAFVVAFLNGNRINSSKALVYNIQVNKTLTDNSSSISESGELIYRVQIAASRVPLSEAQKNSLVVGLGDIEMIEEERWFKYSINAGNSYQSALDIATQVNIKGVFIVPYLNGEKISLKKASRIKK